MKILVAYDGSRSSDNALDDLHKAGLLATDVKVLVLSVAEVWMPPPASSNGNSFSSEDYPDIINDLSKKHLKSAESSVREAETLSRHAKERLMTKFPRWNISSEATHGSPAWEILAQADQFLPDLIIIGSQGRTALSRVLLGSISQKVLTEAKCSVRITRGKIQVDPAPVRLLIGFDGSKGAALAVEQVASRSWAKGSEVHLISACHSLEPSAIGRFISPGDEIVKDDARAEKHWMKAIAESAIHKLENAGLSVKLIIKEGNPKQVLVDSAAKWQADCIFIGAHSFSTLERFLIGTTSTAVAERAGCSVEVVR